LRRFLLVLLGALLVSSSPSSAQIFHKKKVDKSTASSNTAEPDKQLYEKSLTDINHGRQEVGRLGMQTLINTYPDSEYLAKAKLAIADSYYKEGGTSNITQAIAGYKDFIVFFPFLPEAAYAQMQVAMANYNEMAKADRDNTHALDAESEFQTFLMKYPNDPLAPAAQQHLREVQEVLADGQFKIAYYYYVKGDRRAAAGRLIPLVRRYPLYSKSDTALWMLGDIFEKSERKDVAGVYYGLIVKNYPLSPKAPDAKAKLKGFGMPVPQPDPKAVEWMTAQQNTPRRKNNLKTKSQGIFHSGADVHMAATQGVPNMEPQGESGQGVDILSGGKGQTMGTGGGGTGVVLTVRPGEAAPPASAATTEDTNAKGGAEAQSETATAPAGTDATKVTDASAPSGAPAGTTTAPANPTASADGTTQGATPPAGDGASSSDATNASQEQPSADSGQQKESSSKKKGLKKLIPW